jgi:outer membrane protein assembly factor BamB
VLYVSAEAGDLAAYGAGDGVPLWHAPGEGGGGIGGIDLFDGALYTSGERGLDAVNASTGAVEWRYSMPDGVAVLGVANGIVYGVVSHLTSSQLEDSAVLALRADTGKLLWRVGIGMMEGSPLWHVGIGMLACVDRHDGGPPALACWGSA